MTIDGFRDIDKQPFVAFSPRVAGGFFALVERLARRLEVEVSGIENLPSGAAVLVGNHTFGWDSLFPMAALWRRGRRVWVLGEHAWWRFPFIRRLAAAVGTVDGTPANAERLLSAGELVLVLPGGLREALKPRELRYRLLWGHRYGFVRAAIANQVPVVPLAAIGADDVFQLVGDAYARGRRWLHRTGIPLPLPSALRPVPSAVRLSFAFGEPLSPPPAARANDEGTVKRFRHEIEGALHELIERELARRAGIDLEPPCAGQGSEGLGSHPASP